MKKAQIGPGRSDMVRYGCYRNSEDLWLPPCSLAPGCSSSCSSWLPLVAASIFVLFSMIPREISIVSDAGKLQNSLNCRPSSSLSPPSSVGCCSSSSSSFSPW